VLAVNNQFWVHKPGTTADTVLLNKSQPPAGGRGGATVEIRAVR
jgi:hypothetical protein